MMKTIAALLCIAAFLTACAGSSSAMNSWSDNNRITPTVSQTDKPTSRPSETPLPTMTVTPNPTPTTAVTATWAVHPAKQVTAPILLYHHIAGKDDRYYISPAVFRQQMETLKEMGYTGINMTKLVDVLLNGGELPERPVVITFDDGDLDVYQNAFPVMQEFGLVGSFYIVGTRLNSTDFIDVAQLKEMIAAGWDVGCHSMTHIDLTLNHDALTYEAGSCKSRLENELGIPINTFAYPFGTIDEFVAGKVIKYGYKAAVGLGTSSDHSWGTLFYLSRLEVQNSYDLTAFSALLPWTGVSQ
ncbi:MAG: polysaccharide deacetylase family protein [Anaerolineaceae bacterium]